jgi:hypothetical protein
MNRRNLFVIAMPVLLAGSLCVGATDKALAVELGFATEISWEHLKLPSTHLTF